ncbi:hypothetical protein LPJ53_006485 [Coemansia erecta]|uniref:Uncharacterized protein n=1 Tax=Coemansia erecta TaxID=147472 RepID=A0A9W7XT42_9FUNG|nr:hypothetical protein LPJ53_006485 [Coemansia erecta]
MPTYHIPSWSIRNPKNLSILDELANDSRLAPEYMDYMKIFEDWSQLLYFEEPNETRSIVSGDKAHAFLTSVISRNTWFENKFASFPLSLQAVRSARSAITIMYYVQSKAGGNANASPTACLEALMDSLYKDSSGHCISHPRVVSKRHAEEDRRSGNKVARIEREKGFVDLAEDRAQDGETDKLGGSSVQAGQVGASNQIEDSDKVEQAK